MPATTTIGNSRPLAACMRHQPDARFLRALGLVGFGQQRQAIDEAAERRRRPRAIRTRARPRPVPSGSRCAPRLPRCARRAGPAGSRSGRAPGRARSTRCAPATSAASDAMQIAERRRAPRARAAAAAARSSATSSRAQSERGDGAGLQARPSSSGVSRVVVGRIDGVERVDARVLPMPRAGTFTTRRKLTSSCGLMRSRRYASASLISLRS